MMAQYPRGKLNADDEGALRIAIGVQDQTVIIDFGKEVAWVGMSKPEAIDLALILLKHADARWSELPAMAVARGL